MGDSGNGRNRAAAVRGEPAQGVGQAPGADRPRNRAERLGGDHEKALLFFAQIEEPPRQQRHGVALMFAALWLFGKSVVESATKVLQTPQRGRIFSRFLW